MTSHSKCVNTRNITVGLKSMALPVMEFQDQGYKIKKIFSKINEFERKKSEKNSKNLKVAGNLRKVNYF